MGGRHFGGRSIPVVIGDVRYCSIKAAARALGVAPATITARLKHAGGWRNKRRKPVIVSGRHFDSMREAARAFGGHARHYSQLARESRALSSPVISPSASPGGFS